MIQSLPPSRHPRSELSKLKSTPHYRRHFRHDLSLCYLDDPKAWLRDEDIDNICHEIYKDFSRQPWTDFKNLDWFCHYPTPTDALPIKFDRLRHAFYSVRDAWSSLLISERIWFAPLNLERSHWTLLAVDSRVDSHWVVFWDPLGHRCPADLWDKLTNFFVGFTCMDLRARVQYDGFQCGVWVCWAVEVFTSLVLNVIEWNRDTLMSTFDTTLSAHGLATLPISMRQSSSHVSSLLRQRFVDSVKRAASQGSLSVEYLDAPLS